MTEWSRVSGPLASHSTSILMVLPFDVAYLGIEHPTWDGGDVAKTCGKKIPKPGTILLAYFRTQALNAPTFQPSRNHTSRPRTRDKDDDNKLSLQYFAAISFHYFLRTSASAKLLRTLSHALISCFYKFGYKVPQQHRRTGACPILPYSSCE